MSEYEKITKRMLEYINTREDLLNKQRIENSVSITDLSFNCQLWELGKMREFIENLVEAIQVMEESL